ncbi:hypothetical protein ACFWWM_16835 [Streptomyces sp. NPDC058682]|uniref:hypothetical protein n=1 Tax=unclassified Streptomyces TaxID=2593676 RepID=UPI00224E3905|nr:hypothetical protein [Streptomyces sp. NBC_01214]MCX4804433.1 cytochrome P450 [Streptomyces sp. NBC_01214]
MQSARLDDAERAQQLATLCGAGIEPPTNLITNAVFELLTDVEFSADVHAGGASVGKPLTRSLE